MRSGVSVLAVVAALLAALPGTAAAHDAHIQVAAVERSSEPCPADPGDPDPIEPDRVITGSFPSSMQGAYVFLPFRVPADQTALRVKYCFDQPEAQAPMSPDRHTLDLGLYEPRPDASRPWGMREFRGWGGSSHPDVTLSEQGYSSESAYEAGERVPGMTTRAFEPGPIPRGRWAAELGLASIVPLERGDTDDRVGYRVELDWSDDPAFDDDPYGPARYDESPAQERPGWYAGDFHVHAEHSALGDATMTETFEFAFDPLAEGGAGLDFITLSDYVSGSSWDEVGRFQEDHPGKLVVRSAEVITYEGHANSHANTRKIDYRTGPLLERRADGSLRPLRGARPARGIFRSVKGAGGFTQISHPTIFPSAVPPFGSLCRGCSWEYSDRETDYSRVDAIEVATGPAGLDRAPGRPGPNPFTVTAIEFWEDALAEGHRIAAVGSSDSHNAGRTPDPVTQSPIGTATTVVRAPELSEQGVARGVRAGHTYVKVAGNDGPDVRLRAAAGGRRAIMGDVLPASRARFVARVIGGGPGSVESRPGSFQLIVLRNGRPFRSAPVTSDDFELRFGAERPGRYRLQVQRGSAIETLSSPIYLQPARAGGAEEGSQGEPDVGTGGNGGAGSGGNADPASSRGDVGEAIAIAEASDIVSPPRDADRAAGALPFTGLGIAGLVLAALALLLLGARLLLLWRTA